MYSLRSRHKACIRIHAKNLCGRIKPNQLVHPRTTKAKRFTDINFITVLKVDEAVAYTVLI